MVNFNNDEIDVIIHKAELRDLMPLSGNCGPIARAIRDVFGGEIMAVLDENGSPRHAVVEIDGKLYDGTGKRDPQRVVEQYLVMWQDHGEINPEEHISSKESKVIFKCKDRVKQEAKQRLMRHKNG